MMSLYGGTGLGSNGLGVGGINPSPLSALSLLHGGASGGNNVLSGMGSPLASYIGMGGMSGGALHPLMAGMLPSSNGQPQNFQQAMQGMMGGGGLLNGNSGMLQLLQALKGSQTGVQPQGTQPGTTVNQVAPQSPQDLLNTAPTQTMQQNAVAPPVPGQQMQPGMMGPAQMQGDPSFFMRLLAGLKGLGNSGGALPTSGGTMSGNY